MNHKLVNIVCLIFFLSTAIITYGVTLDDFESYADTAELLGTWSERNSAVATITLSTTQAHDGSQSMNYSYKCGKSPYWSEAFTIFPTDQDWSMYDTFSMWVKGKLTSQSQEDMYVVIYKAKVPDPCNHDGLEILGKARFYYVTQKPNWTYWRADIDYDFASLASVRALGIGMTPTSYGSGIIQIDSLAVDDTGLGGVIDNFEYYDDTNDLLSDPDIFSKYSDNCTVTLENEPNVFEGDHAIRVDINHSIDPYWAKVMFKDAVRHLGYDWLDKDYDSLTVHFKVLDADGYIQVALIDHYGQNAAVYKYNGGARIPEGDWVRWDIDLLDIDDANDLDDIRRVEVQFMPIDYGLGSVLLDNIYVNVCGTGRYGVGGLNSNLCDDDCIINFRDLAILASHWGETGCTAPDYCEGADFSIGGSRDGEVNIKDLAVMVNEWLACNLLFKGDCF